MNYEVNDVRYIHFKGEVVSVIYCEDGLWRDAKGCIYGFSEDTFMEDKITRMGVFPFAFPKRWSINRFARAHDHVYSCPAYQMYNTRLEADKALRDMIKQYGEGLWKYMATPIYWLVRIFGRRYWENDKTR